MELLTGEPVPAPRGSKRSRIRLYGWSEVKLPEMTGDLVRFEKTGDSLVK